MNPFEMVVAIVAIGAIASVLRARLGIVRGHRAERFNPRHGEAPQMENERLRDEVKQLKERVAVLERLATDGSTMLDREIEKLRESDRT
jgi:hypothetical protein